MSDNKLTDADSLTLESFRDGSWSQDRTDEMDINRWSEYGNDRLYINAGIPKADKYGLYVDLEAHEIVSDNESKHSGGSVEIDGDTATIVIKESGDKEHEITLSLAGDGFEDDDDGDDEDENDQEIVADGGEDVTDDLSDADIEESIEKNDDPKHPEAATVDEVRDTLATINSDVLDWWSEHQDAIDDGAYEIVHEDRAVIVLADHSGHFWSEQLDAMDIEGPLRNIITSLHHTLARQHCDYSWSAVDPVVVQKPAMFRAGEKHLLRTIARRTDELDGVSRAVDTLATDEFGWSKSSWAGLSGRHRSTVTRTTDN